MSTPRAAPVAELAPTAPELPPPETTSRLRRLLHKYELLLALSRDEPGRTETRRAAMRAIAQRFPAALREWEELSPEELERRHQVVTRQLAQSPPTLAEPPEAWLRYSLDLHDCLRAVLQLRSYLSQQTGGRPPRDPATTAPLLPQNPNTPLTSRPTAAHLAACQDLVGACDVPWFTVTPELLHAIARPAAGRLTTLAYQAVAARHNTTPATIKIALFGTAESAAAAPR